MTRSKWNWMPAGLLIAIFFAHPGWAGSKFINVQGKLTDSFGTPLTGEQTITFRLYESSSDAVGAAIWSESRTVTLSTGLFNVALGTVTALDSLSFSQLYYLGIQVAGDSNELSPRQQLGASAYAQGSLGNFIVGGGVGASSPCSTCTLQVNGGGTIIGPLNIHDTLTIRDPATANYATLSILSGNINLLTSGNSNLSLGTAGGADVNLDPTAWHPSVDEGRMLGKSDRRWSQLFVGTGNSGFAGNVGIGTTFPAYKLHISSGRLWMDGSSMNLTIGTDVNAGGARLAIDTSGMPMYLRNSATGASIHSLTGSAGSRGLYIDNGGDSTATNALINGTRSGTSLFWVGNDGSVGIGTANPASKLSLVDGDIQFSTTSGSRGIVFQDGSRQSRAGLPLMSSAAFYGSTGVSFTIDDASAKYELIVNISTTSAATFIAIRLNGDAGSNYKYASVGSDAGGTSLTGGSSGNTRFILNPGAATDTSEFMADLKFWTLLNDHGETMMTGTVGGTRSGSPNPHSLSFHGEHNGSSDPSSISIFPDSGNMTGEAILLKI